MAVLCVSLAAAGCLARDPLSTTAREDPRPDVVHAWNPPAGADMTPNYEFVAAPDFLNQDVGDVRKLPTWKPGDPNSWTPQLQHYIDAFLDDIAATHPGSVLVAGDLVEGRWGRDYGDTGLFGPVDTDAERAAAVRRAARFYYAAYVKRFEERGLTVHAALGDHDIGDNPWDDTSPWTSFKRHHVALFKRMFARYLTRKPSGEPRYSDRPFRTSFAHTSYATHLSPDVLLVSLDEFHRRDGNVHLEVTGGQLAWLRHTLERAREQHVPWVIVQGHNPVLYPVREVSSSGGHIEGGEDSPLWRTMARYGVDLYINGEVHATTMRQADGLTQVSTGGLLYRGQATYMLARVYDDRIDLDVRQLPGTEAGAKLWQTTGLRTRAGTEWQGGPSISIGSMTLTSDDRPVNQVGLLQEYVP
ncbi:metallophosphoesterase family protein [Nocardioides sp. URHA0032]|uniref:metallophosphoesterase family protein n=1 Tax=Nocardioides sp. URHA0032 TaxID=1380388 RepID=UPI00048D0F8F|nr:metallophosphoesterase [Nocardioides sp. URHA0032]